MYFWTELEISEGLNANVETSVCTKVKHSALWSSARLFDGRKSIQSIACASGCLQILGATFYFLLFHGSINLHQNPVRIIFFIYLPSADLKINNVSVQSKKTNYCIFMRKNKELQVSERKIVSPSLPPKETFFEIENSFSKLRRIPAKDALLIHLQGYFSHAQCNATVNPVFMAKQCYFFCKKAAMLCAAVKQTISAICHQPAITPTL